MISIILSSSRRYFIKLGLIFLLATLIIAPIIAFSKSIIEVKSFEIIGAFIILGINASYSFFFIAYYDIAFSSHQQRYILSISSIIEKIVYYLLLLFIITNGFHFILMYVSILIGSSVKIMYLYKVFEKNYSAKLVTVEEKSSIKISNRGYLLVNQISTQAVESSPTIFIAFNYDLKTASVFSVYYLVMSIIKMIINTVQISISEVFGNLVVSENEKKIEEVFNLMQFVYMIVGFILISCASFLFMPFISLYTRGMVDANYNLSSMAFLIVIYSLLYCIYMPYYTISNVFGFYKETYVQSLVSGLVAIITAFIMSYQKDVSYVLYGLLLYYLSSILYRISIISKNIHWFKLGKIYLRSFILILMPLIAYYIQQSYFFEISSWKQWLILAFISASTIIVLLSLYIAFFEKNEYRQLKSYFSMFIQNRYA
jgi:O-antigen/teichoic acid export membrane protein